MAVVLPFGPTKLLFNHTSHVAAPALLLRAFLLANPITHFNSDLFSIPKMAIIDGPNLIV